MPSGKLVKYGVWERGRFIGAVIFGRGANNHIGSAYGLAQTQVCELVRVALSRHEHPVTRVVSIAIRLMRRSAPGMRLIVSYADPVQGHHGGIYQAGNWLYVGRSQAQSELIVAGRFMHKRSASARYGTANPEKLREITGRSVERSPVVWKHCYLMPLDSTIRQRLMARAKPYPRGYSDDGCA